MGNNQAYTSWEASVVACYDKGVLDSELLDALSKPYGGSDIDSGGSENLTAKDGLDVEEIICKVLGVTLPAYPNLPKDHLTWDAAQETLNEKYWDERYEAVHRIQNYRWGWR
jgi:hypothetical protein